MYLPFLFALALLPTFCASWSFIHGVASGDPSPARIVLWTRITPTPSNGGGDSGGNDTPGSVRVKWRVATMASPWEAQGDAVVKEGAVVTSADMCVWGPSPPSPHQPSQPALCQPYQHPYDVPTSVPTSLLTTLLHTHTRSRTHHTCTFTLSTLPSYLQGLDGESGRQWPGHRRSALPHLAERAPPSPLLLLRLRPRRCARVHPVTERVIPPPSPPPSPTSNRPWY